MNKWYKIVTLVAVVAVTFTSVGVAFAQSETPPPPYEGSNPWESGRGRRMGGGFMSVDPEAIHEKLAEALDISLAELETAQNDGMSLYELADMYLVDIEDLRAIIAEAHAEALAQAVADGTISQEQADWILERQESMGTRFDSDFDACDGAGLFREGTSRPGRMGRFALTNS